MHNADGETWPVPTLSNAEWAQTPNGAFQVGIVNDTSQTLYDSATGSFYYVPYFTVDPVAGNAQQDFWVTDDTTGEVSPHGQTDLSRWFTASRAR